MECLKSNPRVMPQGRPQKIQRTNQNSKQVHIADAKRGRAIGFVLTSDWMKKWREFLLKPSRSVVTQYQLLFAVKRVVKGI